jgi:hypothetical protein
MSPVVRKVLFYSVGDDYGEFSIRQCLANAG